MEALKLGDTDGGKIGRSGNDVPAGLRRDDVANHPRPGGLGGPRLAASDSDAWILIDSLERCALPAAIDLDRSIDAARDWATFRSKLCELRARRRQAVVERLDAIAALIGTTGRASGCSRETDPPAVKGAAVLLALEQQLAQGGLAAMCVASPPVRRLLAELSGILNPHLNPHTIFLDLRDGIRSSCVPDAGAIRRRSHVDGHRPMLVPIRSERSWR